MPGGGGIGLPDDDTGGPGGGGIGLPDEDVGGAAGSPPDGRSADWRRDPSPPGGVGACGRGADGRGGRGPRAAGASGRGCGVTRLLPCGLQHDALDRDERV